MSDSQLRYLCGQIVTRRCVLYVSGFDPKGAAYYHGLMRDEGQKQSQRDGWILEVGPRRRLANGNAVWSLQSDLDEAGVSTHYEFLHWDDIVRAHWTRSAPRLWGQILSTSWFNLRSGALWRMFCISWPPVLALILPVALLFFLMASPVLGLGMAAWLCVLGVQSWLSALMGLTLAIFVWVGGRRLEERYSMYWMMRSYAFNAQQARGKTPELEERLQMHAHTLVEHVLHGGFDEVLLVGHSSGASMAASILGKAICIAPEIDRQITVLSFLTLGQWLPALGTLPQARGFRIELQTLAAAAGICWIDFSAPSDGCCFALQDPLDSCGVDRPANGLTLKVLNPKFADMFSKETYQQVKKNRLNLHFQYIKASPMSVDYDYFLIIAGPYTLARRYQHLETIPQYRGLSPFKNLRTLRP